jgi:hypothetical protein
MTEKIWLSSETGLVLDIYGQSPWSSYLVKSGTDNPVLAVDKMYMLWLEISQEPMQMPK